MEDRIRALEREIERLKKIVGIQNTDDPIIVRASDPPPKQVDWANTGIPWQDCYSIFPWQECIGAAVTFTLP